MCDMKLVFMRTPFETIRVWMYYPIQEEDRILKSNEFKLFQLLSIWGGVDKRILNGKQNEGGFSWELPLSLKEYIKEKFEQYPNCKIMLEEKTAMKISYDLYLNSSLV